MRLRKSPECSAEQHGYCDVYWQHLNDPNEPALGSTRYLCDCSGGECHQNHQQIADLRMSGADGD